MTSDGSVPIDFDATGLRVVACRHCTTWWAEVVIGARTVVREWHHHACPVVEELAPPDDLVTPGRAADDVARAQVDHAVGALMSLYGLDEQAATSVLLLRASVVSLTPADLAVRIVGLVPQMGVEESTRRRITGLLDDLGAG